MDLTQQTMNVAAAHDGDWIGGLAGFGDFEVLTRSLDCPAAKRYMRALYKQVLGEKRSRSQTGIPEEVFDYVTAKTLIDVCILDWKKAVGQFDAAGKLSVDGGDPQPLDYSKDAITYLLLETSEKGVATRKQNGAPGKAYATPDGMMVRYKFKPLLDKLDEAAARVAFDDEDDEGEETGEDENDPKDSSSDGSDGDAASD